jgi:hypothetical protein
VKKLARQSADGKLHDMAALDEGENFYVIVGSSAGALIGLQFVVMTLLAEIPLAGSDAKAGQAFGTPNVVHFGVVLFLSAMICAPWHGIAVVAALWGVSGLFGMFYATVVARRMRAQTAYQAVFEDWLFHLLLPLAAYAMLTASACVAYVDMRPALFALGAANLLLIFVGIHNAWDTVVYHVFVRKIQPPNEQRHEP